MAYFKEYLEPILLFPKFYFKEYQKLQEYLYFTYKINNLEWIIGSFFAPLNMKS